MLSNNGLVLSFVFLALFKCHVVLGLYLSFFSAHACAHECTCVHARKCVCELANVRACVFYPDADNKLTPRSTSKSRTFHEKKPVKYKTPSKNPNANAKQPTSHEIIPGATVSELTLF